MWAEVAALRLLPWTPDQGAQVQSGTGLYFPLKVFTFGSVSF